MQLCGTLKIKRRHKNYHANVKIKKVESDKMDFKTSTFLF